MPATAARTHLDWDEAYKQYGNELTQFEQFVESYEKENQVSLSPGAIELLFVPLIEMLQEGQKVQFLEVTSTFQILMSTVKEDPSNKDKSEVRSSLSVIKAFWKNWCNIPPLCDATKDEEGGK